MSHATEKTKMLAGERYNSLDPELALREQVNEMLAAEEVKVSINDILVKAAGIALVDFPMLNASFFGDDQIIPHHQIKELLENPMRLLV